MPRRIDVFFYGLFMDVELLAAKGVAPTDVRRGSVRGYRLAIGKRASLVPDGTSTAHGVVMSLDAREVDALYAEPGLEAYRPEAVLVDVADGGRVPALCFNLLDAPAPDDRNPEYASALRGLAERLRLPAPYVASIR